MMESEPPVEDNVTVLVHHDGALGDVLLSLPGILRVGGGAGSMHFAGRGDVGALLRACGLVAEASSTAEGRYARLVGGTVDEGDRRFLSRFERAVLFTVDPGSPLARSLRSVLADVQIVLTVPPETSDIPVTDYRTAQVAGPAAPVPGPLLPVPALYRELAAGMLARAGFDGSRPLVAVHPGSGGREKNWPLDRFFAVLDRCRERAGVFALLFSGPAEEGDMQDRIEVFARQREGTVHFAGADLPAVAALLHAADRYLGNDSGVSHLAAAVGCRALVLYGPTSPIRWRPAGAPVEAIRSADLGEIAVDAVVDRVLRDLSRP